MPATISTDYRLATHPNPFLPARLSDPGDEPSFGWTGPTSRRGFTPLVGDGGDDGDDGLDAAACHQCGYEVGYRHGTAYAPLGRLLLRLERECGELADWQKRAVMGGWEEGYTTKAQPAGEPYPAGDDCPF